MSMIWTLEVEVSCTLAYSVHISVFNIYTHVKKSCKQLETTWKSMENLHIKHCKNRKAMWTLRCIILESGTNPNIKNWGTSCHWNLWNWNFRVGASMVKWTNKVLQYTTTIIFMVKGLKVVAKRCLNWISFHDDFRCCVEYSNIENQVEILNTYH